MKKLINRPDRVVEEMIEGLLALYPEQSRIEGLNVLLRSDAAEERDRKVALISGGGSGHEPAHAGYIGRGMLTAAVAGEVFTSPSAKSVYAAIKAVGGSAGVALIVKNYTGDRLNFGFAAEMARADGLCVEIVTVAEDVALLDSHDRSDARGIAGTVLVHKIAGAAAEEGRSLKEVVSVAQAAADDIGTMGISLAAGTSPVTARQSFLLGEREVELGLGIHGEPGIRRMPLQTAAEMVDLLIDPIVRARNLLTGDRIAVLVNNLGSTTPMELAIVGRSAYERLESQGLIVERMYAGTFLSSLDMAGVSISIMRVDDERLRWLDAPVSAPAWPNLSVRAASPWQARTITAESAVGRMSSSAGDLPVAPRDISRAIEAACKALIDAEDLLTEMDREVGDGDLGNNLARAARAVQSAAAQLPLDHVKEALREIGVILQDVMGGSSGPLYGVLFLKAAAALDTRGMNDLTNWAAAVEAGCVAISEIGGARPGDRTMLDALVPFVDTLAIEAAAKTPIARALTAASIAAEEGARKTANMLPRRGRSSYLAERALGHPDPGAIAASIWLRAVSSSLIGNPPQ
ncbi:MAG: dihydroxyacetone kinase subunit DhaL [Bryobacteraceae bacterium]